MNASVVNVFLTFLKLGLTSFGGPIAHIGYYRKELVEKQKWVSEAQFSQLLAICQFLPGPASSQLGFSLGLLRGGLAGAIMAFLAFTIPSALLLIAFAWALPMLEGNIGQALIHGLKLVACVVVADAVVGMFKKLCPDITRRLTAIFATAFLIWMGSATAQIIVILLGAVIGIIFCKDMISGTDTSIRVQYQQSTAFKLLAVFVALLALLPLLASQSFLIQVADIFYRAGALVFGGGHVVLPLLEESVVETGLISKETFLAGYGASQAIPGPIFAFSAYLGVMMSGESAPWLMAAVALVFMFLPGFLLVLAALPLWQRVGHRPLFINAVAGLNAAVVGLLAAALYDPIITSGITSVIDVMIVAAGFLFIHVWKRSALWGVLWCCVTSLASMVIM
jgi:chromate transporter